jgi:phosphotransferase family enzyme
VTATRERQLEFRRAEKLVLDTVAMTERLLPLLPAGVTSSDAVQISAAVRLGGQEGTRAVVAYHTGDPDADRPSLIGKVFADPDRARRLHDLLTAMNRAFVGHDLFGVPRPVAYLPDLNMVVYLPVTGPPLDATQRSERPERVARAAGWLAALHGADLSLGRRLDMAKELSNVVRWGDVVMRARPATTSAVSVLLGHIRRLGRGVEMRTDVPIHKDFHYQHTLYDGPAVGVIDLDEARAGDPAFDVAHYAANLRMLAFRDATPTGECGQLESAFLHAYRTRTGYEKDARHEFVHAYTCMKIAKQLVTGRGPGPAPVGTERDAQVDHILREGLRCPPR